MRRLKIISILLFGTLILHSTAQQVSCTHLVDTATNYLNGVDHMPGDTFCIEPGTRGPLYIGNMSGSPDSAIVFINHQGIVNIESEIGYGISVSNCQYIKLIGTGATDEYGIRISDVPSGSGIKVGMLSSDIEISNFEISNTKYTGITAKSDPTCLFNSVRDSFTMYNTHIHHNYIHDVGTEGMYIGNSFYTGVHLEDCDTTVLPHILDGVDIHHNIVERSGWDGIQLGCALYNSRIYNNVVINDSESEKIYQMSGIMVNPGSACDVFNNKIINGKGTGISLQGVGGLKVYNNLIVNAGIGYEMDDQINRQKFGIFCKYTQNEGADSSYFISQNTIVNPKSDGIRFQNRNSTQNKFYNNVIVNPGAFQYYEENGNISNEGIDSYIYIYFPGIDFDTSNNYFSRSSEELSFIDTLNFNYKLNGSSPLVNSGLDLSSYGIIDDLDGFPRPYGGFYDIGAYEYSGVGLSNINNRNLLIYPNPFSQELHITNKQNDRICSVKVYDINGKIQYENDTTDQKIYDLGHLKKGIYLLKVKTLSNHTESIKLIKL